MRWRSCVSYCQSEENIRKLFVDAEQDQKERGDDSDLHIIIFDEIDAVCKQRGSVQSSAGVHDTVVNQLLSKMDGVNSLNNILVRPRLCLCLCLCMCLCIHRQHGSCWIVAWTVPRNDHAHAIPMFECQFIVSI
jgi:hypothetical protein